MIFGINYEKEVIEGFWCKVKQVAGKVPFVPDTVSMYFCAMDPNTPLTIKLTIFTVLAYFILPVDAVPDLTPIVGHSDDAAVIAAAMLSIQSYITDEHKRKARIWLSGNC